MENCKLDNSKICNNLSKQKNSHNRKELETLKNNKVGNQKYKYIKDKSIKKYKNKDNSKIKHYFVYQSINEEEQYKDILKKANKNDIVEYISQNAMGYKRYKIIIDQDKTKKLKLIGNFEGLF